MQSTTVEAGPPVRRPAVEDRGRCASPSWATIAAASRASGSPETLAEVVGSGPRAARQRPRRVVVGHPHADRRRPAGQRGRQRRRPGAAARRASGRPASRPRRGPRAAGVIAPIAADLVAASARSSMIPLLGRALLRREQALDAVRRARARPRCRRPCRSAGRRRRRARRTPIASPRPGRVVAATGGHAAVTRVRPRVGRPPRRPSARRRPRASPRTARTSASMIWAAPFLGQRRRDVAGDRLDLGRRGRHRGPVADLGEHLEVVALVADRQDLPQRDAEPAGEPADRPALRHARRDELEELRVADRHVGPAGEPCAGPSARRSVGSGGSPTAMTFVTGCWIARDEIRHRARRGRPGTSSSRRRSGRRPGG